MMQTEPCKRRAGKRQIRDRLRVVARGIAAALAAGVLAPLLANAAFAGTTIAHTRQRARQATAVRTAAQTESARRPGHAAKGGKTKAGAGHTLAKSDHAVAKAVKPVPRVRPRSRRHADPVDDPDPVMLHRAGARRAAGHGRERGQGPLPVKPAVHNATPRHTWPPVAPAEEVASAGTSRPLTTDDFLRAAVPAADETQRANGKVYVRGESHTEVDDRISDQPAALVAPKPRPLALKPIVKKSPMVVARVEPMAPVDALPSLAEDPPADFTGVPLAGLDDPSAAEEKRVPIRSAVAPLPPLSRQEVTEEVEQPVLLPGLYRNGRLVVPAPLKGTHEILVHQNLIADDEGLERIEDDADLRRLRAAHLLVDFPESASLRINPELGANRRCARVWSVRFAANIGRDFYARFHEPLQVNSAVRTVAYQVRLQRTNGNAAGIDGDTASPHLTGQAMDLGKRGMSVAQIAWMRAYLLPLMQAGKVDVEEEFQQACFHISVYRTYMPAPAKRRLPRNEVAALREPRVKSAARGEDVR